VGGGGGGREGGREEETDREGERGRDHDPWRGGVCACLRAFVRV
jgi:hypothetical protein